MNFCSSFLPRADEVFSPSFFIRDYVSRFAARSVPSVCFTCFLLSFPNIRSSGHVLDVWLAHDKNFDSERVSFDLYLFQSHHLLSDKICFVRPCMLRCFQPRKAFVCHADFLLFDIFSRRYSKSFLFFMRTYSQQ